MTAKPQVNRRGASVLGLSAVTGAALLISGCTLLPAGTAPAGDDSSPSIAPAAVQPGKEGATTSTGEATDRRSAGIQAQELARKVQRSLSALGTVTSKPTRDQLRQAFLQAGAPAKAVELSADRTPTGLAVDAMEGAAVVQQDCVIGQVRDGKATVTILPVLATGRCFIGDQH